MPELPEAEVVRRGMARWAAGATAGELEVLDPRSVRRSPGGADALRERLAGAELAEPARRGKFLWLPLAGGEDAVVVHLGMSGQVRVDDPGAPDQRHLRLRLPVRRWATALLAVEVVQIAVGLYQARNGLPELAVGVHMVLAALAAAAMTVVVLRLKAPVAVGSVDRLDAVGAARR